MRRKYLLYSVFLFFGFTIVIGAFFYRYLENKTGLSLFSKRPFISVVVTSYNYEKYIRQTLDSILAQSYKNYEVIVVDDGSKDNSVGVINEYVKKYKNFHLYQHDGGINQGLPASFKLGVEKAKGDYIAVLESDDYWAEDNLLEKVKMLNKYPDAVIISNNVILFGENYFEVEIGQYYVDSIHYTLHEVNTIDAREDLYNHIPTFSAVMIKKDILKQLDFDTPIPAFLDLYLYKQIWKNYPLYYIKKRLTYWRRHSQSFNSITNQPENNAKADVFLKKIHKLLGQ